MSKPRPVAPSSQRTPSSPDGKDGGDRRCPELPAKSGHGSAASAEVPSETPGLTSRQERAIDALLHDPTLARAAATVGINERTLRRWTRTPVFRSALLRARREAFSQAIGLTQRYAPVAVATLVKVMNDTGAGASAKVTAAAILLKFGREGIELEDLAERVEALERGAKGSIIPSDPTEKNP